jgi:hypothetical protein
MSKVPARPRGSSRDPNAVPIQDRRDDSLCFASSSAQPLQHSTMDTVAITACAGIDHDRADGGSYGYRPCAHGRSGPRKIADGLRPSVHAVRSRTLSGEGGIRTHGTLTSTHDFQSCTFGLSVTSPGRKTPSHTPEAEGRKQEIATPAFGDAPVSPFQLAGRATVRS